MYSRVNLQLLFVHESFAATENEDCKTKSYCEKKIFLRDSLHFTFEVSNRRVLALKQKSMRISNRK